MEKAFVIQFHAAPRGDHYDLLLEAGPALAAFELVAPLAALAVGESVVVPRLADHRRAYLTYEGEIAGGRGHVRIVDRGHFTDRHEGDAWIIDLVGLHAGGRFRIEPAEQGRCRLTREA